MNFSRPRAQDTPAPTLYGDDDGDAEARARETSSKHFVLLVSAICGSSPSFCRSLLRAEDSLM